MDRKGDSRLSLKLDLDLQHKMSLPSRVARSLIQQIQKDVEVSDFLHAIIE